MQLSYAVRYRCDGCAAEADVPDGSDPMTTRVVPEGWASGFRFEHWQSGVSRPVSELCPACASMSLLDLIKMLEEKRNG